MPISDYAARLHGNKDFNGANYTPTATMYVGFRSGGVELSGGNYSRIAVTVNTTNFPTVSTGDTMTNAVAFSTPTASADWDEADEVVLYDASSGGNELYSGPLDAPFTVLANRSRTFAAGALRVRFI